jgi:tetratricopeptide (TPR) repeat protein
LKRYFILTLSVIVLSGCSLQFLQKDTRSLNPRENAALQLTQEGRQQLGAGKPDNAIRLFEQAIGLNPNDGECYYYLAEAWLVKGVKSEAKEFNSLARDYLKDDAAWKDRVMLQQDRIERLPK